MTKVSIRFYKGHEVRAVWDDANNKWWFSVIDVVGVLAKQTAHYEGHPVLIFDSLFPQHMW